MADINVGDVLRVAGVMNIDGQYEITNVWHMLVEAAPNGAFLDNVADIQQYFDLLVATTDTFFTDNQFADHLEVQNVTTLDVFGSIDWGTFAQGGAAQQHTALGVCVFAWARTRRPRVQIRKYFGVFTENDLADGVWQAGVLGACNASMAVHVASQTLTNGLELQGVAWNRAASTYQLPINHTSSAEPAYQRRRKRGVGS